MSLLWSLHPPDGPGSWLFGTMHVRDNRVYALCHRLYPLILQSDAYVGEMDLDAPEKTFVAPSYDLMQQYTPKVYYKLRRQLMKSFQLDVDQYGHLHPLMIISAVSHRVMQADHAISLDEHLWAFAKQHSLSVTGLESADEQMQLLHALDPGPIYMQLRHLSERPWQVRRFTHQVLQSYLREEVHDLYHRTKSSLFHLRKPVLYSRNVRMAARIQALEADRRYFITVGAGHLSGKTGLISLLRQKGWGVRPASPGHSQIHDYRS